MPIALARHEGQRPLAAATLLLVATLLASGCGGERALSFVAC